MADSAVMHQDVNPHIRKGIHLKPNQHCSLDIDIYGTHRWRNPSGQLHRVGEDGIQDGPVFINSDGYQFWYLNGICPRLDGPAVILTDGYQEWWVGVKS